MEQKLTPPSNPFLSQVTSLPSLPEVTPCLYNFSNNRHRRRANRSTKHPLHRTLFPLRLPIRIPSRHRILHLHSRETSNPLRMVNLRRPRPSQIISLRRYGESELDDRDANFDCRGQK